MNRPNADDLLIARLLDLPAAERAEFWQRMCAEHPGLRERSPEVARLLTANGTATVAPATPASLSPTAMVNVLESALSQADQEAPGNRIGHYKLLQKIGEGGFGAVWMAEQQEPIRRRVALKIVKIGMDTEEVIARFEAERQALALMDHPNIARVFDAGATPSGRPFFVMELVRGVPITHYCDENRLTPEARLRLVVSVCQAVQHAHQKGVIHRDLKPSNILVTLHDGVPVPKVIDFGIAKATDKQLTEKTLVTQFHAFVGTPVYTSPEQMEMSGLDVDTRSDIYSLGVLLYELLAGRPPFDPDALIKSGLDAMRRTIREVDPPRPSNRLGTLSEADRTSVAQQRGTDAAKLRLLLRGDVDWIVMHCLEKDRTRRYETANALARDVQRHLAHEPVAARPPSQAYRVGRFVRRHRVGVAASAALVLSLLGGLVASSALFVRERAAHGRAVVAEQSESRLRQQAETARTAEAKRASRTSLALAEQLFTGEGRSHEGIAHLVRAARSDPANHAIGPRLVSALAHRNFAEPMGEPLVLPAPGSVIRYTNDGRHAVIRFPRGALQYWDLSSGRQIQRFDAILQRSDLDPVSGGDLSPDAPRIAVGFREGIVVVWDYATGRQVFAPLRHEERISYNGVRFSPDGRWLATASTDRTAKIWEASTGVLKAVLPHDEAVSTVGFSRDSARVATATGQWWRIWRVPGGEAVFPPKPHSYSTMRPITFSPDGTLIAINGNGGAEFRDASTGAAVGARMVHQGLTNRAAFSNDGKMFATTSTNGLACLWEVPSGRPLFSLSHEGGTVTAQFTPDDRYLFVCSDDGTARVWDVKTGRQAIEPVRMGIVIAGDLSPDGTEFMTAGRDGVVRRWRLAPSAAKPLEFPADGNRLAFVRSQDGAAIAWAIYADRMQQIDLLSGRPVESARIFPTKISSVLLAPNQQRLGVRTTAGATEIWEFQNNQFKRLPLERYPARVTNPRFSADSTRLAGNSSDGVWVWNADTGALVAGPFAGATISGSTDDPFSPDRRRLVAVDDNRVIIFDLASGQPVGEPLRFHAGNAGSPVFSPDGSLVATVSNGGTAQLWDAHTTRPVGPALVHRNTIMRGVRFTRDGQRLLTWNRMAVCVWDVATGRQLVEPIPAGLDIDGAVFSEDGSRIATSARVGRQVRLWDSSSGQLLSEPAVGAVGFYDQPTFHLSARFLATGYVAEGYAAQVMALPPSTAREPVPEWLLRLATTLAGAEIDQSGALCERASEAKALDAIRRELASQRPDAPYVEWGRWILADRATRPIGPGFKITTAEAEELNSDTSERDLRALDRRANELERIGQFAEAGEIARQGLELARQSRGGESRVTAYWAQRLAWILIQAKQPAEAEPAARAAIAIRERLLDADDPVLALVRQRLGWALLDQQRHAEAEPVLLTAYEAYQRVEARASLSATQKSWKWQTAELLARLYEATQQPAKAAEWRQKAEPAPASTPAQPAPQPNP